MEEITNSKKRNEKLRKVRQAKFEKRQRVEKISQFRRIADVKLFCKSADLQNNLRKRRRCMSSPLLLTDNILGLNSYPNRLVCFTIIICTQV